MDAFKALLPLLLGVAAVTEEEVALGQQPTPMGVSKGTGIRNSNVASVVYGVQYH